MDKGRRRGCLLKGGRNGSLQAPLVLPVLCTCPSGLALQERRGAPLLLRGHSELLVLPPASGSSCSGWIVLNPHVLGMGCADSGLGFGLLTLAAEGSEPTPPDGLLVPLLTGLKTAVLTPA